MEEEPQGGDRPKRGGAGAESPGRGPPRGRHCPGPEERPPAPGLPLGGRPLGPGSRLCKAVVSAALQTPGRGDLPRRRQKRSARSCSRSPRGPRRPPRLQQSVAPCVEVL